MGRSEMSRGERGEKFDFEYSSKPKYGSTPASAELFAGVESAPKKKSNKCIIIGVVVGLLVVIGAGVGIYFACCQMDCTKPENMYDQKCLGNSTNGAMGGMNGAGMGMMDPYGSMGGGMNTMGIPGMSQNGMMMTQYGYNSLNPQMQGQIGQFAGGMGMDPLAFQGQQFGMYNQYAMNTMYPQSFGQWAAMNSPQLIGAGVGVIGAMTAAYAASSNRKAAEALANGDTKAKLRKEILAEEKAHPAAFRVAKETSVASKYTKVSKEDEEHEAAELKKKDTAAATTVQKKQVVAEDEEAIQAAVKKHDDHAAEIARKKKALDEKAAQDAAQEQARIVAEYEAIEKEEEAKQRQALIEHERLIEQQRLQEKDQGKAKEAEAAARAQEAAAEAERVKELKDQENALAAKAKNDPNARAEIEREQEVIRQREQVIEREQELVHDHDHEGHQHQAGGGAAGAGGVAGAGGAVDDHLREQQAAAIAAQIARVEQEEQQVIAQGDQENVVIQRKEMGVQVDIAHAPAAQKPALQKEEQDLEAERQREQIRIHAQEQQLEQQKAALQVQHDQVCPTCGHCPTCGRKGAFRIQAAAPAVMHDMGV